MSFSNDIGPCCRFLEDARLLQRRRNGGDQPGEGGAGGRGSRHDDDVGPLREVRSQAAESLPDPPTEAIPHHGSPNLPPYSDTKARFRRRPGQDVNGGQRRTQASPGAVDGPEILASGETPARPQPAGAHPAHSAIRLDGHPPAPLGPSTLEHAPSPAGSHPSQKPMHPLTAPALRLVGSLQWTALE